MIKFAFAIKYCFTHLLFQALIVFGVLIYIHSVFAQASINCLEHVEATWPRDGILRVEILRNVSTDYDINQSYQKEYSDIDAKFSGREGFTADDIFGLSGSNGTDSWFSNLMKQVLPQSMTKGNLLLFSSMLAVQIVLVLFCTVLNYCNALF